jgi:hypothetical protein
MRGRCIFKGVRNSPAALMVGQCLSVHTVQESDTKVGGQIHQPGPGLSELRPSGNINSLALLNDDVHHAVVLIFQTCTTSRGEVEDTNTFQLANLVCVRSKQSTIKPAFQVKPGYECCTSKLWTRNLLGLGDWKNKNR